jgi:hypothetical protein
MSTVPEILLFMGSFFHPPVMESYLLFKKKNLAFTKKLFFSDVQGFHLKTLREGERDG